MPYRAKNCLPWYSNRFTAGGPLVERCPSSANGDLADDGERATPRGRRRRRGPDDPDHGARSASTSSRRGGAAASSATPSRPRPTPSSLDRRLPGRRRPRRRAGPARRTPDTADLPDRRHHRQRRPGASAAAAFDAGADEHVVKPLDPEQLLTLVRRIVATPVDRAPGAPDPATGPRCTSAATTAATPTSSPRRVARRGRTGEERAPLAARPRLELGAARSRVLAGVEGLLEPRRDLGHRRARREDRGDAGLLQPAMSASGMIPPPKTRTSSRPARRELLDDPREQRDVGAREDREADGVGVLLQAGLGHLRRASGTGRCR